MIVMKEDGVVLRTQISAIGSPCTSDVSRPSASALAVTRALLQDKQLPEVAVAPHHDELGGRLRAGVPTSEVLAVKTKAAESAAEAASAASSLVAEQARRKQAEKTNKSLETKVGSARAARACVARPSHPSQSPRGAGLN